MVGRYVISVIINLICVFILQSNEHIEKLAHESDALLLICALSHGSTFAVAAAAFSAAGR